jgi:glycosyltransferase involved in cell wall biosynthesis
MRIAMLSDDWWPETGGGPVHVKALSIALAERFGDRVDVFTRKLKDENGRHDAPERYADGKVRVIRLGPCTEFRNPAGRIASAVTPLGGLLRSDHDYDVIHGHTYVPAVPLRLGRALTGTPTVFTVHGLPSTGDHETDPGLGERLMRWTVARLVFELDHDAVVSVNRRNVGPLAEHHERVRHVPNGVDLSRFRPDLAPTEQKVLYVGRLDEPKRVRDLVDAFAAVAEEFPDLELVVVGSGPRRAELERRAAVTGVGDRIQFVGEASRTAVARHYASARLFVLPTRWEGQPLSVLEAWAAEVPVVATDVDGVRELVEHRENGYLVEPKSAEALAAGLRHALSNPDEAAAWCKSGRETVRREFTWKRCAERTREVYETVVRDGSERVEEGGGRSDSDRNDGDWGDSDRDDGREHGDRPLGDEQSADRRPQSSADT